MTLTRRIGRSIRWLKHRISPGALILVYHRVVESSNAGQSPMTVTTEALSVHLALLRQHANPMSLTHLVQTLRNGQVPQRAVAVTFDDGYANNLYHAKPLLERHEIPATVFVTTGHLGRDREFWWDELKRVFLQPGPLPEKLCLTINGISREWQLKPADVGTTGGYRRQSFWSWRPKNTPTSRGNVCGTLHKLLKASPEEQRREIMDTLVGWAGVKPIGGETYRPMTPEEVRRLAEGELVEIGAHTVTHPVLSTLPAAAQRKEIRESKRHLEELLGYPVRSFAYPYGSRRDYTAETVALVQEAGFQCACSNFRDVIFRRTDLFQLARIPVRNWDGEEFVKQLGFRV